MPWILWLRTTLAYKMKRRDRLLTDRSALLQNTIFFNKELQINRHVFTLPEFPFGTERESVYQKISPEFCKITGTFNVDLPENNSDLFQKKLFPVRWNAKEY